MKHGVLVVAVVVVCLYSCTLVYFSFIYAFTFAVAAFRLRALGLDLGIIFYVITLTAITSFVSLRLRLRLKVKTAAPFDRLDLFRQRLLAAQAFFELVLALALRCLLLQLSKCAKTFCIITRRRRDRARGRLVTRQRRARARGRLDVMDINLAWTRTFRKLVAQPCCDLISFVLVGVCPSTSFARGKPCGLKHAAVGSRNR